MMHTHEEELAQGGDRADSWEYCRARGLTHCSLSWPRLLHWSSKSLQGFFVLGRVCVCLSVLVYLVTYLDNYLGSWGVSLTVSVGLGVTVYSSSTEVHLHHWIGCEASNAVWICFKISFEGHPRVCVMLCTSWKREQKRIKALKDIDNFFVSILSLIVWRCWKWS